MAAAKPLDLELADLEQYLIQGTPSKAYYIPKFITPAEADYLWKQVYAAPLPKWTQLSNRRLQNWGGLPHPKGMVTEPLPKWLSIYCDRITKLGVFGENKMANHVLVNEYTPGQGIMPHTDGPLYTPVVTTISLGSHTLLDYYSPIGTDHQGDCSLDSRYLFSLLLEPCSLVIVMKDMYTNLLHGIAERPNDTINDRVVSNIEQCATTIKNGDVIERSTRVSLTIRNVPKVVKMKLKF